jgi:hypothetical protein
MFFGKNEILGSPFGISSPQAEHVADAGYVSMP